MVDTESRELRENGFVRLPALATGDALDRLRRGVARLEELVRDRTESAGDFVLESPGIGGWAAWQQGAGALAGVLRSADRIHVHVPEFDAVQRSLGLAEGPVARAAGAPGTLVNAFLWAKPPVVGSAKPWHQDMAFAPPGFGADEHGIITVWVALEPATVRNGCLEFIPEPHVADEHLPRTAEPVAVPLEPGSAVLFDGLVLHRSAPNTTAAEPRTAVSFVYRVPLPSWSRREPAAAGR